MRVKVNGLYSYDVGIEESERRLNSAIQTAQEDGISTDIPSEAPQTSSISAENRTSSISAENRTSSTYEEAPQTDGNVGGASTDTPSGEEYKSDDFAGSDYDVSKIPNEPEAPETHMSMEDIEGIHGFPERHVKSVEEAGIVDNTKDFMHFMQEVKTEGFAHAVWGKSFFEVVADGTKAFLHDLGMAIVNNGDIFFLFPAIGVMFATFFVGKNKYSKFIIPLWFAYLLSVIFSHIL